MELCSWPIAVVPRCMVVPCVMKSGMRVTGNMLRGARHVAGLRQTQLAKAAKIDPATLSRMESFGAKPVGALTRNLESVLDALKAHGVEVSENAITLTRRVRR
jgi:ribosome-binding protein aMBF1 (putative translation factor)